MSHADLPQALETYALAPSSASVGEYLELLKPRVMALVVFTSVCGLVLAPGTLHPFIALIAILSIATGAGGSGCLNMWYERSTDALMQRTKNRPLPQEKIDPDSALAFGLVLSIGSIFLMAVAVNYIAALLLAFTIFFYVGIYTVVLKPRTPQNIVIGGVAGALPPLIGWVACTGTIGLPPVLMSLIIFFWTVPHFWALALVKAEDYAKAGIPMMPNVRGKMHTKRQMVLYAFLTVMSSLALWEIGFLGALYGVSALLLGIGFLFLTLRLLIKEKGGEMMLFSYSIAYLFLIFLLMLVDRRIPW